MKYTVILAVGILCLFYTFLPAQTPQIPSPPREFRGVWIATVSNIDWPSRRGLSAEAQKKELTDFLDKLVAARMNAVVFQIRPMGDALYESSYEPWSQYLTGTEGQHPGYDPLEFAIEECHKRGLELHAWINPFRVSTGRVSDHPKAINKTHPEITKKYSKYLWLDPTDQRTHDYVLKVIEEIVQNYDVDAMHFDDYFYPYPDREVGTFPDTENWEKYKANGGKLSRDDWRRDRVNSFVAATNSKIKEIKPDVMFGISPFGIWRSGHPSSVKGLNAVDELFADSRHWLTEGDVDYLAPQLYWSMDAPSQRYTHLIDWWSNQNPKGKHLWPGLYASRFANGRDDKYEVTDIIRQVEYTQKIKGSTGNIHFSAKVLRDNTDDLYELLKNGPYAVPALTPASPWLDSTPPSTPKVQVNNSGEFSVLRWENQSNEKIKSYVVYAYAGGRWWIDIIPPSKNSVPLSAAAKPEIVAVSAIDRRGNESNRAVIDLKN